MRFPHITLLNLPHFCFLSVAVPLSAMAAEPEDFSGDQIAAIWREVWKTGEPKIKEPKIEKLAEGDVVQRMAGTWTDIWALMISLSGNRLVEVSGRKDGAAWKKNGQWRVISDIDSVDCCMVFGACSQFYRAASRCASDLDWCWDCGCRSRLILASFETSEMEKGMTSTTELKPEK